MIHPLMKDSTDSTLARIELKLLKVSVVRTLYQLWVFLFLRRDIYNCFRRDGMSLVYVFDWRDSHEAS